MEKRKVITEKGEVQLTTRIPELDAVEFVNSRQDVETLDLIGACGKTYSVEKTAEYMKEPNDEHNIYLTIIHRDTGKYLGDIRLVHIEKGIGEIGIVLVASERGKGYGTDAMKALISYGFDTLKLQWICLRVYECNPKAKALYERLGFRTVQVADDGYCISTGQKSLEYIMLLKPNVFQEKA